MKYSILLLPVLIALNCGDTSQHIDYNNSSITNSHTSSELAVTYPLGAPTKELEEIMRWGQIEDKEKQLLARNESNALMNEAFKITYKEIGIKADMNAENLGMLIEKSNSVFQNHLGNPALFLAEQMVGMKIQEFLFPGFINQSDISIYKDNILSSQELDALVFTTKLFVKNKNPNVDLIVLNLHHLEGVLDYETATEFKEETKINAENWFNGSERI